MTEKPEGKKPRKSSAGRAERARDILDANYNKAWAHKEEQRAPEYYELSTYVAKLRSRELNASHQKLADTGEVASAQFQEVAQHTTTVNGLISEKTLKFSEEQIGEFEEAVKSWLDSIEAEDEVRAKFTRLYEDLNVIVQNLRSNQ